jgi:hypothetical protein
VAGDHAITGSAASASQWVLRAKWLSRTEKPSRSCGFARPVDRQGAPAATPKTIVLDMDSSESPTYGEQESTA